MATHIVHHPAAMSRERALKLVDRYRAQQLDDFRNFRVNPGTGSYHEGPDDEDASWTVSGAYPDGSYRVTMRPGRPHDAPDEMGRPPVVGYGVIPPPTVAVPAPPPDYIAIYRPESISEAAAAHLVTIYRMGQLDAVSPSHGRQWFRRRPDASRPTERVTGAYPDGSYFIETGGGWTGDGPLSVVWTHPDIDANEGFVATTPAPARTGAPGLDRPGW